MRSDIKFVSDKENNQKKEILKLLRERNISFSLAFYNMLLYSKYIIEKDDLNYSKIINGEVEDLLPHLNKKINNSSIVKAFVKNKIYELLKEIAFKDYEISVYKDRVLDAYIKKEKKYLIVCDYDIPYINYPNVDMRISKHKILNNQLIDEITGVNRKYYELEDIAVNKYDSIIYINDGIKYTDFKERSLNKSADIFEITKYNYLSEYRSSYKKMKSVLFDKDKVYIEYLKNKSSFLYLDEEDSKINIKELSGVSDENLSKIIESTEEIKDISLYVSLKDIMNNGFRIGFSSFKINSVDRSKALRLVAYNEAITAKIRRLDEEISKQINNLIVR